MKKQKLSVVVLAFALAAFGMILFLSKASIRGGQDYFEGIVVENANDYIIVQFDASYEKLIRVLGETVKIEKRDVVQESDFSKYPPNESVRVIYSGIDSKEKRMGHIFAVYVLSEIGKRHMQGSMCLSSFIVSYINVIFKVSMPFSCDNAYRNSKYQIVSTIIPVIKYFNKSLE